MRGVFALIQTQKLGVWCPGTQRWAVAAANNLDTDLLAPREVPCAWPAPALAGGCCYLRILPLRIHAAPELGCIFARAPRKKKSHSFFWVRVQKCGVGFLHPGAPGCTRVRVHFCEGAEKKNITQFFFGSGAKVRCWVFAPGCTRVKACPQAR